MNRRAFPAAWAAFLLWIVVSALATGAAADPGGERALLARYPALEGKLEHSALGAPIYLESAETANSLSVDTYGVFRHPFSAVRDALQSPANWCEITPLHINVKACTWQKGGDSSLVTLYSGRKYYETPAAAYPLRLRFRVAGLEPGYLEVNLSAEEGPLHTRNHRMKLEAVPVGEGRTLVHLSYSYGYGSMTRMAMKTYFATLGHDKVGFTRAPGGQTYVGGVRGAIERNAVRYYLAIESFLDTADFPESQRFERRAGRWYDLTARYPRQLKEMDKPEYLSIKRQERGNQLALQRREGR